MQTVIPPTESAVIWTPPAYAGVMRRFVAMLLDRLFLLVITTLVVLLLSPLILVGGVLMMPFGVPVISFSFGAVYLILSWLYFAIMEGGAKGGGYGKRLMGIRVVGENGQPVGFARATLRYVGRFLSALFFMVGYLMALITSKKQTLHDMIAETVVVRG